MTRTAGAPIGCQRPSRFWGLGCPKIYHEAEDTLDVLSNADEIDVSRLARMQGRRFFIEHAFREAGVCQQSCPI
ncbi:hypothetical protein [Thiolapillus sp.]|uniref:hypothetical protein n=1 Tax=Thiolapillus sp. TaxID=2017437 RepID=UPI003AF94B63